MAAPNPPPNGPPRRADSTDDHGVFDDAKTYYTADDRHANSRAGPRTRTYSQVCSRRDWQATQNQLLTRHPKQNSLFKQFERLGLKEPYRRGSHGTPSSSLSFKLDPSYLTTDYIYRREYNPTPSLPNSGRAHSRELAITRGYRWEHANHH